MESICKKIANNPNATLGDALNEIENKGILTFHGAEKEAFKKLYGWTSGSNGIRHALMDASSINQEDAHFMLISCSAFINLLTIKAAKAGIKLMK